MGGLQVQRVAHQGRLAAGLRRGEGVRGVDGRHVLGGEAARHVEPGGRVAVAGRGGVGVGLVVVRVGHVEHPDDGRGGGLQVVGEEAGGRVLVPVLPVRHRLDGEVRLQLAEVVGLWRALVHDVVEVVLGVVVPGAGVRLQLVVAAVVLGALAAAQPLPVDRLQDVLVRLRLVGLVVL